jgi:hypothetical protein
MLRVGTSGFLAAVMAVLVVAVLAGLVSSPPSQGAPSYALDSSLVYRLEIGMAFFLALYVTIVLVRLASHGLTPSSVGTAEVQLPQLVDTVDNELRASEIAIDDMLGMVEGLSLRMTMVERSIAEAGREFQQP